MTTPARVTDQTPQFSGVDSCDVCGHADVVHDAIARRFCAATMTGALTRNCICPSTPTK